MPLRLFFAFSIAFSLAACGARRDARVTLHTDMGDIRVRLFGATPALRDHFLALALRGDTLSFDYVERDFALQFGKNSPLPTPGPHTHADALPTGGTLACSFQKITPGGGFLLLLDRPQSDASLDILEKERARPFTPGERQAYKKHGGSPHLQGQATVFGEVTRGLEVAQRIAAVPRDSAGRPLQTLRVWVAAE